MTGIGGAKAQCQRAVLTHRVGTDMPAVEIAIGMARIEFGLRVPADDPDMPLLIETPVSTCDETLGGVFQGAVGVAIDFAAIA